MATSSDDVKKITNRKFKDGDSGHYAWNRLLFT